jgi:polyisoprenoid-binding protein YceI
MSTTEIRTARAPQAELLPTWTFDPRRTEVRFLGRRMGTTWVNGRFTDVRGTFYLDTENPVTSSCVGEIDVANLYAGEPYLNTQLRAADFLGVGGHRAITFAARLAEGDGDTNLKAEVFLTISATPQRAMMDVAYLGEWEAPVWTDGHAVGVATRMGMRAEGFISPAEFRVDAPSSRANGNDAHANALRITLDLEAILDADLKETETVE